MHSTVSSPVYRLVVTEVKLNSLILTITGSEELNAGIVSGKIPSRFSAYKKSNTLRFLGLIHSSVFFGGGAVFWRTIFFFKIRKQNMWHGNIGKKNLTVRLPQKNIWNWNWNAWTVTFNIGHVFHFFYVF